jgi:hypothetical protein
MTNSLIDPPEVTSSFTFDEVFENNAELQFYFSYRHLPVRNFTSFSKNVNELYELVYYLLYEERITADEILIFEYLATGNSIEGIIKLLEKVGLSKKGFVALSIVGSLIAGTWLYDSQIQATTDITKTQTEIVLNQSETAKNKAEAKKAEAETYNLQLQNILLQNKIKQDSIDRIKKHKDTHKIFKKTRAIDRSIKQAPINYTVINGNVVYNNSNNTMLE